MLLFLIPVLLMSSVVNSLDSFQPMKRSAASESQISFAIENKYDQTGPGAKGRELAYNTYNNLEDALVGYLDDPDTKLPEYERAKGTQRLINSQKSYYQGEGPISSYLNTPYAGNNILYHDHSIDVKVVHPKEYHGINLGYLKSLGVEKPKVDLFSSQKFHAIKSSPVNLGHYSRDPQENFDLNPQYSHTNGVRDQKTADSKVLLKPGSGETRQGFYTITDSDGKQRTVQYASDANSFRAFVL